MINSKDALNRIKVVLGLTNHSFASYKNEDGVEFYCEGDKIELDKDIYVVTPEGNLPAPDGDFEFLDGTKVSIKEGKISKLSYDEVVEEEKLEEEEVVEETMEEEKEEKDEVKMAEATLVDGIIVSNDEDKFEVGQELFIVSEEGKDKAPDGEHETTEGQIVVVEDGKIIEIKEKVEASEEEEKEEKLSQVSMDEVVETFSQAIEALKNELEEIKSSNNKLTESFNKFSNEPAGEKVYTNKSFRNEVKANKMEALEKLRRIRTNK